MLTLEEWLRGRRHDPATKEWVSNKQSKRLVHILEEIVLHRVHHIGLTSAQLENLLDDRDLRGRRVQTAEAVQSVATRPAPITSEPRLTVPATRGTCSSDDSSSFSAMVVLGCTKPP